MKKLLLYTMVLGFSVLVIHRYFSIGIIKIAGLLLILLSFITILPVSALAVSAADMISYYRMEDNLSDLMDCQDAGCSTCPTYDTGYMGRGVDFNGVPAEVNVLDLDQFDWAASDSFTIEFWMKKGTPCAGTNEVIVGRDDNATPLHLRWWIGVHCTSPGDRGKASFQLRDKNNVHGGIVGGKVLTDGEWHHVVAVRDAASTPQENRLYVDGQLVDSLQKSYTAGFDSATAQLNIGWLNLSSGYHYAGLLDELAIYNRALSEREVRSHYYLSRGYLEACTTPVKIMPLGDSITYATYGDNIDDGTGYRQPLWLSLIGGGYNVDFVGSEKSGVGETPVFDHDNAGFPGISDDELATLLETGSDPRPNKEITNGPYNRPYLDVHPADVILLHIGTNRVDPDPGGVERILNAIDQSDEGTTVILARIIDRQCSTDQPPCIQSDRTNEFNDNIVAMAGQRIANGDRIIIVDMQEGAGIDYQADMLNPLHPNSSGYQKMAAEWMKKLETFLPVCTPSSGVQPVPGISLLFDTSGSMSWRADGSSPAPPNEQRIHFAKAAAIPFLEMVNDFRAGTANFGIATFPGHPIDPYDPCTAQVVTPMTTMNTCSKTTAVTTTIPSLTTGNGTPLLAGVEKAATMFGPEMKKVVVLLSDGYHNCPSLASITDPRVAELITGLKGNDIRVFTIGFGRPTDVDHPLLQALADETTPPEFTGSQFHDVTTSTFDPAIWNPVTDIDLMAAYKSILVDVLDLQAIADPPGTIDFGEKQTFNVKINGYDHRVSFFLSWSTPGLERLQMKITSSDGDEVPVSGRGIRVHQAETYFILMVDQNFLSQEGKVGSIPWNLEVLPTGLDHGESEHFLFSVIADSALKFQPGFDRASYGTGDTITLTARLTEDARPITGLSDVKVIISAPKDGKGNWLSRHEVNPEELEKVPKKRGTEILAPHLRKAIYLLDVKKIAYPAFKPLKTLPLYDDGSHGDTIADDGIYTNQFTGTDKEGIYSFHFLASGQTSGGQGFDRDRVLQKHLPVKVAPEFTHVDVAPFSPDVAKHVEIRVTPKDAMGNLLGPGYDKAIKISTSHGELVGELHDQLDGSYTQVIDSLPHKATLGINVLGSRMEKEISTKVTQSPRWWLLLVVLLIVLAVALLNKWWSR